MLLAPVVALVLGWLTLERIHPHLRRKFSDWPRRAWTLVDLASFIVGLAGVLLISWLAGHGLEALGFDPRGQVPATLDGTKFALGIVGTYAPRNALVVGFVMGFAIIPIIYTIADDALSTVPDHLRSASLGAGATPWQTAMRVVVPTAMSGLFSAVMIGLGRAVGETMIVLMAAGNTPIMDWNIFNGFQTLSALIAQEMPEAVRNSTHYRALFVAAVTLFGLTFVVNTGPKSSACASGGGPMSSDSLLSDPFKTDDALLGVEGLAARRLPAVLPARPVRTRQASAATSLAAQGEPMLWLAGGALARGGDDDRRPVGVGALPGTADLLAAAGCPNRNRRRHDLPGRNRRPPPLHGPTSGCWRRSPRPRPSGPSSERKAQGGQIEQEKIRVENFELTNNALRLGRRVSRRAETSSRVGPGRRAANQRPVLRPARRVSHRWPGSGHDAGRRLGQISRISCRGPGPLATAGEAENDDLGRLGRRELEARIALKPGAGQWRRIGRVCRGRADLGRDHDRGGRRARPDRRRNRSAQRGEHPLCSCG